MFSSILGQKFLCSEVIAPIRSEIDDISLFIINFEDLTNPAPAEPLVAARLSKCKLLHMSAQIQILNTLTYKKHVPFKTFDL